MRRMYTALAAAILLISVAAGATGCTRVRLQDNPATATKTLNKSVDLAGATRLSADIAMGVGELTLSGSETTGTAMIGTFVYAPSSWQPAIVYSVEASVGTLSVRQPENTDVPILDSVHNTWDVQIARNVPTDLHLTLGVGRSDLNLRGVDLTALAVDTGVGETTLDLSGPRTTGFTGRINAGVGKLTLRLPRGVGARVTGGGKGLGDFTADGISVNSNSWVNDAWSGNGPKIDIALNRGVGQVEILLVD